MQLLLRNLILILFFHGGACLHGQVDAVSFDYRIDDLASYRVVFESYYITPGGQTVYFTAEDSGNYDFFWEFGDGSTGSQPAMMHSYMSAGTYDVTLTITDISDPSLTMSDIIEVTVNDAFEVPNVFTPDGDGINDVFIVRSNGVTPLNITIFDRGGSIVYQHTSPIINWDGRTPGGTLVRPGVYYYVITSSEPFYNKKGFIHVYYGR